MRNKKAMRGWYEHYKIKAFTLVELLAVIVILAIIALIATPIVIKVIGTSKEGAAKVSSSNYLKAVETSLMVYLMDNPIQEGIYEIEDGKITNIKNSEVEINVEVSGEAPKEGQFYVNENGNIEDYSIKVGEYYITSTDGKNQEITNDLTIRYRDGILNGADPIIKDKLIAVTIEDDGEVKKADINSEWYNYENKIWANAVVLFGEDTYAPGDVIDESAIKQYYVWIPRYRYELWNTEDEILYPDGTTNGPTSINIVFESKNKSISKGTENGEWLTHPAFTSFDTNGIWVGKFETSYNESTFTDSSTFLKSNPNTNAATTGSNIIIKPNVRSLTNKNVSSLYTLSRDVNSNLNSHMMKNAEWGAMAYLTYSEYGKCTNKVCEEVYINNVNTGYRGESATFTGQLEYGATITGCSASSASASPNSNNSSCESEYAWNEANNKASTTGNTSGIYDTNGGNWEYMMAVIKDESGNPISGRSSWVNSGFNGTYGCPTCDGNTSGSTELTTGIAFPSDTRYYDLYTANSTTLGNDTWYKYDNGILGDATKEVAKNKANNSSGDRGLWYSDYAYFPSMADPWFVRGGYWGNGSGAGALSFNRHSGHASSIDGSRVVLTY